MPRIKSHWIREFFHVQWLLALACVGTLTGGCGNSRSKSVILYCSQDQSLAEPILRGFEQETGWRVLPVYDSEAVKTVGLANRLVSERNHPVADVYWGNEEFRARQLMTLGVLDASTGIVTFGRRSRQWVVREGPLPPELSSIRSMVELTNPAWKARISMANPGFGTTSTHFHVLRQHWGETNWLAWCQAFVRNRPFLEEGNSQVVQRVARGEALIGLTDSDDISAAQREGLKVRSLGEPVESFSIPNTIAGIRNAPHPEAAAALIAYLRSPKVELRLIEAGGLEPTSDKTNRQGLHPRWATLVSDLEVANRQLEHVFRR